jgi:hypothetical protein
MTTQYDPWAEANNPPEPVYQNFLWGRVTINAWLCALVKGVGKVPYDPQEHNENRFTAIDISIEALPEMNITNDNILKRSTLATSKDWRTIIKPSLDDLGYTDARQVVGKWVKVETVRTGRTYYKDGEEKHETTFKFVEVFADEAACRADFLAANPEKNNGHEADEISFESPASAPAPAPVPDDKERKTAWAFAQAALKSKTANCKTIDEVMAKVPEALAMYPQVSKFFSPDSPEVMNWLTEWEVSHAEEMPF